MKLLAPLIFALLVLIQAMPGLGASSCSGFEETTAQEASCPCCADRDLGCAPAETLSCCCGRPAPADPALPTNDTGGKKLDPVAVGPAPVWAWMPLPPAITRPVAAGPRPAPRPPSAPAQALLCVRVV